MKNLREWERAHYTCRSSLQRALNFWPDLGHKDAIVKHEGVECRSVALLVQLLLWQPANLVVPALRCMAEWFSCFNLGAPPPGMVNTYAALFLQGLDLPCIEGSKPLSLNRPQGYVGWRQAYVGRRCLDYVREFPAMSQEMVRLSHRHSLWHQERKLSA